MKILEVVHRFPPAIGGSEKVVFELSKEFVKQGHDVTVVTSTSLDNNDTRGFSTGRRFSLKSSTYKRKKEFLDGVRILRFDPDFQFWTFAPSREMKKFLKENINRFDIVHVHGYQAYEAYIVSKLCRKQSRKYVLTAHDIISHYPGFFNLLKKTYDFIFGRNIIKQASGLVALTPENFEQYNDVYESSEKISIIPNGINDYEKRAKDRKLLLSLGNPQKVILFLGRIVEYKGCQFIIDALPKILEKYPKTKAVFVGKDGGYTKNLIERAESLSVKDHCVFTGPVDDIEKYLNLADVFVFPSRGEGFGLAPVEAMSVGVPAILADMGGLKYVLQDIGGVPINMNHDIVKQIEDKILDVFTGKFSKQKIEQAEKNSKNYNWDKIASRTIDFFKKCL